MYQPVTLPAEGFILTGLVEAADTKWYIDAPPVVDSAKENGGVMFEASTTGAESAAVACPFGLFGLYAILFYFYTMNQFDWSLTSVNDVYGTGSGADKLPSIVCEDVVNIVTVPDPMFLM